MTTRKLINSTAVNKRYYRIYEISDRIISSSRLSQQKTKKYLDLVCGSSTKIGVLKVAIM